jgi:hypothetical protein
VSSLTAEGDRISAPFIFIATNRLKPGAYEAERDRVPGLAASVSTMAGVGSPLRLAPCGMAATRRIMADGSDLPVSES